MDGVLWERAARYRRIAAALGDEEMKRKRRYATRLGPPAGNQDQDVASPASRKALAAD